MGLSLANIINKYPQSNGLSEKGVQIAKKLIKKAIDSKEDINLALLAYRTAPLEYGLSPSEQLMGRKLKTKLPIMKDRLQNRDSSFRQKNIQQRQVVQNRYHDSKAKDLAQLKQGGSCED